MSERKLDLLLLSAGEEKPPALAVLGSTLRQERLEACLDLDEAALPDAILLGLRLADASPIHAVRRLSERFPDTALVVCANLSEEKEALILVEAGATDYVLFDVMDGETLASRLDYALQRHTARALFQTNFRLKGCKPARAWDWAFELGSDLTFKWLSQEFQRKQHLPPDRLLGKTPWEADEIDPDPERWRQYILDFKAGKPFTSLACRIRGQEHERLAFRMWGEPMLASDGAFLGYAGTAVDISAEVENASRLTDAYELLKDMFDDLQSYKQRLDDDLEAARISQLRLLPKAGLLACIGNEAGVRLSYYFEPTSELGGDIWGALSLGDGRFALYLADFSGHGVAAALNTFRLTTLIQEHRERRAEPAAYLEILNERLKEILPSGQYATMLYGIVDAKAGSFVYAAAASPRPLVVDLATGAVEAGEGRGLPLGAVLGAKFMERELPIRPGSMIVLASDALLESLDMDGKSLGKDGVADLVRDVALDKGSETNAEALLAPFLAKVARPLKDDLTLVACRVLPV